MHGMNAGMKYVARVHEKAENGVYGIYVARLCMRWCYTHMYTYIQAWISVPGGGLC